MELNIGSKIQASRKESGMTQETAAEELGVSRQTISNWETGKSYPDIISVLRMSELYHVSLDYLLKGNTTMKTYYDYLEESTNVVKSNRSKGCIILVGIYLLIWAISMAFFWLFTSGSDAMGYSLMFLWLILPANIFVCSLILAIHDYFGKWKWFAVPVMGLMYMLSEYGTFSLANTLSFGHVNMPEFSMILIGGAICAAGLGLGTLIRFLKERRHVQVFHYTNLKVDPDQFPFGSPDSKDTDCKNGNSDSTRS